MNTLYLKTVLFSIFIGSNMYGVGQTQKTINGVPFEFVYKKDTLDNCISDMLVMCFENKEIHRHIIKKLEGDCSSENLLLGTYSVKNDSIIFYSYWASADRMGENIFPFGFNKIVFRVEKNGGLSFSGGRIYIETTARGSELLRKDTLTKQEESELGIYQELLEYKSLSRFVVGTERQRLEKEVRLKLNQEIENNTADWEQVYRHYNK